MAGRLLSCLILCSLVVLVSGWGPYTHQFFTCDWSFSLRNVSKSRDCFAPPLSSFLLGGSSPDVFKTSQPMMHDLVFAGYQLQLALSEGTKNATTMAQVFYSLGYGAHLCADLVGHYPDGYLTPAYDHELEFAVDTAVFKNFSSSSVAFTLQTFNASLIAFVEGATQYYATVQPSFAAPTLAELQADVGEFNSLTGKERDLIEVNFLWKEEMVKEDNYGAANFSQADAHFLLAEHCSYLAYAAWAQALLSGSATPEAASAQVNDMVVALFANKTCIPR